MSTTAETFVALGAIDPDLATPFLASGQRLVLDPTDEELAAADAAIVRAAFTVDKAMLDRMPALKVLARTGVGTDLVDVAEAARRGIPVVITPGFEHQCRCRRRVRASAGRGQAAFHADHVGA